VATGLQGESTLNPEAVEAELRKILASKTFASSEQLRAFLRFTVGKTLQGSGDQIKEYLIGVEVFNRGDAFDPRTDSIVRAQAKNLRSRLEKYYSTEGLNDPVLIEYEKGSYTPLIGIRETPAPAKPDSNKARWLAATAVLATVAIGSLVIWQRARPAPQNGGPSIAVLPFIDMSEQKDQEYFCDGITEELINALAQVPGLRVVARTSAFEFKGKGRDIRKIGEQLNVRTVLEGSVRKAGGKLRVTAQLNNAADGYHLWSETYDRDLKDVFAIQEEISQAIVRRLKLEEVHAQPLVKKYSDDLDAYDDYLKGRQQLNALVVEDVKLALNRFQQTLVRAPGYAPAHAAIAEAYYWLAMRSGMLPEDAYPKAREAAQRALALDDGLAEAHSSLAAVLYSYDWNWPAANLEFQRALTLSPNSAAIRYIYARYLTSIGDLDGALREISRAEELDPLSLTVRNHAAIIFVVRREFDRAIEQCRRLIASNPGFYMAYSNLGLSLLGKHKYMEAMESLTKGWDLSGHRDPMTLAWLASGAALSGDRAKTGELLSEMQELARHRHISPHLFVFFFVGPGDKDKALDALDRCYAQRDVQLSFVRQDFRTDSFRSDPRFTSLIQKMQLP
jgi:serine/threonine-protein kinase